MGKKYYYAPGITKKDMNEITNVFTIMFMLPIFLLIKIINLFTSQKH